MKNTSSLHALVGTMWVISLPLHKGVTITINWTGPTKMSEMACVQCICMLDWIDGP